MGYRYQERDGKLLDAIFQYGGVLGRRHLRSMFWPNSASPRAMQRRLSKLKSAGYVEWPTRLQYRIHPCPEPVIWLGFRGALVAASRQNVKVSAPKNSGEEALRKLQRDLRYEGFRWLREPRWQSLKHELAAVDVRLRIEAAVGEVAHLQLAEWLHENAFLTDMDVVEFEQKLRDGTTRKRRKGVRPDGYFMIVDRNREAQGLPANSRFLLEIDMSTHPNRRFAEEKAMPGAAYIGTKAYKMRFGHNSGRWLVVSTSRRRIDKLRSKIAKALDGQSDIFRFTTFDLVETEHVLTSSIWWSPVRTEPVPLFAEA